MPGVVLQHMPHDSLRRMLLRQTGRALGTLVLLLLFAETVMPGSVTPYLDPLPLAVIAIIFLALDAALPYPATRRRGRLMASLLAAAIAVALAALLLGPWSGVSGVAASILMSLFLTGTFFLISSIQKESF